MTQPGDQPTSPGSGRSIYERLGLAPSPPPPLPRRAPIIPPAPGPRRAILRYLIGIPAILVAAALLWTGLPTDGIGIGVRPVVVNGSSEDERRMDVEDSQEKALEMRIQLLEIKVRALQELNGYQAASPRAQALPAVTDRPAAVPN